MPVMSYCPHCGSVFPSPNFRGFRNTIGLRLEGNKETCPNCGKMANVQDGVFDVINGVIREIRDANLSPEQVRSLATIVRKAKDGEISKDKLAEESALIDPKVGSEIGRALAAGPVTVLLILLLTILNKCTTASTLDWNKLYDQMFGQTEQTELIPKKDDGGFQDTSQGKKGAHTNPAGDGASEEKRDVPVSSTHQKPPT